MIIILFRFVENYEKILINFIDFRWIFNSDFLQVFYSINVRFDNIYLRDVGRFPKTTRKLHNRGLKSNNNIYNNPRIVRPLNPHWQAETNPHIISSH